MEVAQKYILQDHYVMITVGAKTPNTLPEDTIEELIPTATEDSEIINSTLATENSDFSDPSERQDTQTEN